MSEYLDIVEERDGYRVRLEYDDSPEQPYDDGAVPILQLSDGRWADYIGEHPATAYNRQAEPYLRAYEAFAPTGKQLEVFERYLRIFHGMQKFQEWNVGNSREYAYVGFDTAEWRAEVGAPETLKDEDYLEEVRAWAEGDVYGYIVERDSAYGTDESEDWEEVESVWGHYGREWAEQAAREALTSAMEWDATHPAPEVTAAPETAPERSTLLSKLERVLEDLEAGAVEVAKTRIRGLIQEEGK